MAYFGNILQKKSITTEFQKNDEHGKLGSQTSIY